MHFAVDNIRDKSLLDVLKSNLFAEYQKRQPFSDNMLRPCPIIDNPQALRAIVQATGAHPTHEGAETVLGEEIGSFLDQRSAEWKRVSDPIWEERQKIRAAGRAAICFIAGGSTQTTRMSIEQPRSFSPGLLSFRLTCRYRVDARYGCEQEAGDSHRVNQRRRMRRMGCTCWRR